MTKRRLRLMAALIAVVAACAVGVTPAIAQDGPSADALLAAASDKLVVEGDVDAAIRVAEQIVSRFAKADRPATARALLMLGDFHALKGDDDGARRIYERLRSEFSDQQDAAGTATRRLRLLPPA